jgi:hypothetical protein
MTERRLTVVPKGIAAGQRHLAGEWFYCNDSDFCKFVLLRTTVVLQNSATIWCEFQDFHNSDTHCFEAQYLGLLHQPRQSNRYGMGEVK